MPYLKKLTPESHQMGATLWHDMFPEMIDGFHRIKFREYFTLTLVETEKLLRKIRLVFSKIDRVSNLLITHVRRVHRESASQILESTPDSVVESAPISQDIP